jgi:integrase
MPPRQPHDPEPARPRRPRGTGSIRRKNGCYEISPPRRGGNQEWTRLPDATYEEAEAALDALVAGLPAPQMRAAVATPPQYLSFEGLWERYREDLWQLVVTKKRRGTRTVKRARFDDVCSMMRAHLLPAFGKERLGDITTDLLDDYVAYKTAPDPARRRDGAGAQDDRYVVREGARRVKRYLEPATIRDHIELVGQMYRWGAEQGLTAGDPTVGVTLPALPPPDTKPLEPEHALLTLALIEPGTPRTLATVLVACGLRLSEGLGMPETAYTPRRDAGGTLAVERFLTRCGGGRMELFSDGKTDGARRELRLSATAGGLIEDQIRRNRELPAHDGCLFPSVAGTPWNPSNFRNRHWTPGVNTAYVKLMHPIERERWLAAVPADLRDIAIVLTLDEVTVKAVSTARLRDVRDGALRFTDTDGNERSVALPDDVATSLAERANTEPSGYLVPRRDGRKIHADQLVRLVFTEPFRAAGIRFDQRIHRARHTFASMAGVVNRDLPPVELQRQLGHSNAASREVYVHSFKFYEQNPADVLGFLETSPLGPSAPAPKGLDLTAEEIELIRALRRGKAA